MRGGRPLPIACRTKPDVLVRAHGAPRGAEAVVGFALVTAGVGTDVLGIGRDALIPRHSKPSPMRTRDPTSSAGFWTPSLTASRTGLTQPSAP